MDLLNVISDNSSQPQNDVVILTSLNSIKALAKELLSLHDINQTTSNEPDYSSKFDHLLTEDEARQYLGGANGRPTSRPTMIRWEKQGRIHPKRIGRRKFYTWEDIQAALK